MQAALEEVFVSEAIERYIVDLVQATRGDGNVALGASPRGALAVLKLARAEAALARRDFVTPDDVKAMAIPALAHRLILKPELWVRKMSAEQVVTDLLARVPAPAAETRMSGRLSPLALSLAERTGDSLVPRAPVWPGGVVPGGTSSARVSLPGGGGRRGAGLYPGPRSLRRTGLRGRHAAHHGDPHRPLPYSSFGAL